GGLEQLHAVGLAFLFHPVLELAVELLPYVAVACRASTECDERHHRDECAQHTCVANAHADSERHHREAHRVEQCTTYVRERCLGLRGHRNDGHVRVFRGWKPLGHGRHGEGDYNPRATGVVNDVV